MRCLSYSWSLLWGLYFYVLFQLVFFVRFGSFNTSFSSLDISLVVIGILSVVILVFFKNRLERGRKLLFIPFALALPVSVIGALGGGLLGVIGVLIYGLVPFAVALPIGYWLIKRFTAAPVV